MPAVYYEVPLRISRIALDAGNFIDGFDDRRPVAVAIGNFDGMHLGHQALVQRLNAVSPEGRRAVLSFYPHPRIYLGSPSSAGCGVGHSSYLQTVRERVSVMNDLGVTDLVLMRFTKQLCQLSPDDFVEQVICRQLKADIVVVGDDWRFGRERAGDVQTLANLGRVCGFATEIVSAVDIELENFEHVRVSSRRIRNMLQEGEVEVAARLLGREYVFIGRTQGGKRLGRQLGFPTLNIAVSRKFLPRYGVYAGHVRLPGTGQLPAVINIGLRPTVSGDTPLIESHLLDWSGEEIVAGTRIEVSLKSFVREEKKFDGLSELKQAIGADVDEARKRFSL
ncbi:MAG: riboflavin biosynthesis protein RibF [bacterium]|nr:riboflavin biosynthesis protein RibF [bacterium]